MVKAERTTLTDAKKPLPRASAKQTKPTRRTARQALQRAKQATNLPPVENPYATIRFIVMSEKAVQLIESQNKMSFIVTIAASKPQIRTAVEAAFQTRVKSLTTLIDRQGRKKAIVTFVQDGQAGDIAVRLGII